MRSINPSIKQPHAPGQAKSINNQNTYKKQKERKIQKKRKFGKNRYFYSLYSFYYVFWLFIDS